MRTAESIRAEVASLVKSRSPQARAFADGRLWALVAQASDDVAVHSAPAWVLRAHLRMLDRLDALFTKSTAPADFELLALARNLFESLIWARLFNRDQGYGLIFFNGLLEDQIKSQDQQLQKLDEEIALFEQCDARDSAALDETIGALIEEGGEPDRDKIHAAQKDHRARTAALDAEVRRRFSLYAEPAQFNGYGYQVVLMRKNIIPEHEAARAVHVARKNALNAALPGLLDAEMLKIANQKWQWKANAVLVGMLEQYNYLYSLTSRLLHATPLNIMSDHELTERETIILHEYIFVAVGDMLDEIEAFTFEGQSNIMLINVDTPAT